MSSVSLLGDSTVGLPLHGVRVLDLTQVWAGPYATRFLADMGAEVIKIESIQRPDSWRMAGRRRSQLYPDFEPGERFYDREARSNEYNRNKLGITLDLRSPHGKTYFLELVKTSDVVAENFSAGVMDRLGLSYETLRDVNAAIIMLSMPGFGSTGPEAHFRAYGPIQEAMGGITSVTGYPGEQPLETAEFYGDPTGAVFGAAALFAALWHQKRTGQGCFIDFSQREAMIACLPELVLEYTLTGRIMEPLGNGHEVKAPHSCYRCAGEDAWLVISVGTDAEWQALCVASSVSALADARFATVLGRLEHRADIDALIEGWTVQGDHYELMHRLQAAGVAAEAVMDTKELVTDPHFNARGFIDEVAHPQSGTHLTMNVPWLLSGMRAPVRMPSPLLGQHNDRVLQTLLGLSSEELDALRAAGVIGDVPVGLSGEAPD